MQTFLQSKDGNYNRDFKDLTASKLRAVINNQPPRYRESEANTYRPVGRSPSLSALEDHACQVTAPKSLIRAVDKRIPGFNISLLCNQIAPRHSALGWRLQRRLSMRQMAQTLQAETPVGKKSRTPIHPKLTRWASHRAWRKEIHDEFLTSGG